MIRFEAVIAQFPELPAPELTDWIARGWIQPDGATTADWTFADIDVARVRLICDLRLRMAIELWRRWRVEPVAPARIAEAVNRELCQNNNDRMFVTLFLGLLDTRDGTLAYVNAGHPLPHPGHSYQPPNLGPELARSAPDAQGTFTLFVLVPYAVADQNTYTVRLTDPLGRQSVYSF